MRRVTWRHGLNMPLKHVDPSLRHDFVLIFDVRMGNPNGDPDMAGAPRLNPHNHKGLVSDVSIKRKIRDWVHLNRTQDRDKIYIVSKVPLDKHHKEARKKTSSKKRARPEKAREWMLKNFYDVRMFGAVMSMKQDCGDVKGPVSISIAESVDPVYPIDMKIVRSTPVKENSKRSHMLATRKVVPYGLYVLYGNYSPALRSREVTSEDLQTLWSALEWCWYTERSSTRGRISCRGLYVFSQPISGGVGVEHDYKLFSRISINRKSMSEPPSSFSDYLISFNEDSLPSEVVITKLV